MLYVQGEFFVLKLVGLNFYYYKDEGKIEVENDKELKKIKFIRENDLFYNFLDKYKVVGSFLLFKDMFYKFVESKKVILLGKVKERVRVLIDRLSFFLNIYYFFYFEFESSVGLWFYFRINDQSLEEKIKVVIRFLGDEGFGGDRICGFGSFEVNFEESSMLEENDSVKYYMSLLFVNF